MNCMRCGGKGAHQSDQAWHGDMLHKQVTITQYNTFQMESMSKVCRVCMPRKKILCRQDAFARQQRLRDMQSYVKQMEDRWKR